MDPEFTRYVVFLTPVSGITAPAALIRDHIAWLRALDRSGALELAGPFANRPGGLVILRAASLDGARRIAATDPFVVQGARTMDVAEWALSCEANNHMGMG